jgi:hypothetical protein
MDEEWRGVAGWDAYEVSNLGRIRRTKPGGGSFAGRIFPKRWRVKGYPVVTLSQERFRRTLRLNRVVCRAFHGDPPSPAHEAAHADGIRDNCTAENLRWATPIENAADKIRHGSLPLGERHSMAKLTAEAVREIRSADKRPVSKAALAKKFGVAYATITDVLGRRSWTHLE